MRVKLFMKLTLCTLIFIAVQTACLAAVTDNNPNNVALNKTVTDINNAHVTTVGPLNLIVDGNQVNAFSTPPSRVTFSSSKVSQAVFEIDLVDTYTLSGIDVMTGNDTGVGDFFRSYYIEQFDGSSWVPIEIARGRQISLSPYQSLPIEINSNGYKIQNLTCGYNYLYFKNEITTNKVRFVSQDTDGTVRVIREIMVYKAQTDNNIAYRKPVISNYEGSYSNSLTHQLVPFAVDGDFANDDQRFMVPSSASPNSMSQDFHVDIDLLGSYVISNASVHTGSAVGGGAAPAFKLQAYVGNEFVDIPNASVTGNSLADVTLQFLPVRTNKVRVFFPKGYASILAVREIKLFKTIKLQPPLISIESPSTNPASTWNTDFSIIAKVVDMGGGIAAVRVYKNDTEIFPQISQSGDLYAINITGLESGANNIYVEAEDLDGDISKTETLVINTYSETGFLTFLKACGNIEELSVLIGGYAEILSLSGDNFNDTQKWGYVYTSIISNKDNYISMQKFLDDFAILIKIDLIRKSDITNIVGNIKSAFPTVKWMDYNTLDGKDSVAEMLVQNNNYNSAQDIENAVGAYVGLQYIKEIGWGSIRGALENYKAYFKLNVYGDYLNLSEIKKNAADSYIAGNKRYKTLREFTEVFEAAVEYGKNYTANTGGGGSGGSGGSGRAGGTTMTAPAPAPVVQPIVKEDIFTDIGDVPWASDAITYMALKNIINGVGDRQFAPNEFVTREQFVKMLLLTFFEVDQNAQVQFNDVKNNEWYYPYVATGVKLGIVNGLTESEFGTGVLITREQMITLTYRAAIKAGAAFDTTANKSAIKDDAHISSWALYAVKKMCDKGIINLDSEGMVQPKEYATRAQAAKVLYETMNIKS